MFVDVYEFTSLFIPEEYYRFFSVITIALICYLIWICCDYLEKKVKYYKRLPPGPWGVPYLGCLPEICSGSPHEWYLMLANHYGDIFSVKLGQNLVACIGSAKLLRELFNRLDSTGRPHTPFHSLLQGFGIITSEGVLWRRQRQFLTEKFRSLGVKLWANQRFEQFILMEIEELQKKLESLGNTPSDPVLTLGRHVHNVICQLMMSFRFKEDDPHFKLFNESVTEGMKMYGEIHIGEHLPWYMNLPGKRQILDLLYDNYLTISHFHARHIRDRRFEREQGIYKRQDLLDYYLDEIESNKPNDIFSGVNPDRQIIQVMNDLFSAGMETVRNTLVWALVIMLREPEVAAKVRRELAKVVNPGEIVMLEHRLYVPYVEAVLFEVLRRVSVVPFGTTHVNTTPWHVNGYLIPAGTQIIPLLEKINMDPELYPEPEKIIPERFLNNDKIKLPEHFLPFGVGRRICLGEQLARMELFLFFANIMNSFEFHLPEGETMPELEGVYGTTHSALPYNLIFKKIDHNIPHRG